MVPALGTAKRVRTTVLLYFTLLTGCRGRRGLRGAALKWVTNQPTAISEPPKPRAQPARRKKAAQSPIPIPIPSNLPNLTPKRKAQCPDSPSPYSFISTLPSKAYPSMPSIDRPNPIQHNTIRTSNEPSPPSPATDINLTPPLPPPPSHPADRAVQPIPKVVFLSLPFPKGVKISSRKRDLVFVALS